MRPLALLRTPLPPHVFVVSERRLVYGRLSRRRDAVEHGAVVPFATPAVQLGPVGMLQVDRPALEAALRGLGEQVDRLPRHASLVVPDAWVRALAVDVGMLPRQREEAEEQVRWRLKRLLPCRPEDIRLDYLPLGDNGRCLVVLALERPLAALEDAFAQAGVRLGRIEPTALAVSALAPPRGRGVVVAVEGRSLGIAALANGRLQLLREKLLPAEERRAQAMCTFEVARTVEHPFAGEAGPAPVWLAAGDDWAQVLAAWAAARAGVAVRLLDPGPAAAGPVAGSRLEVLALLGGAREEGA